MTSYEAFFKTLITTDHYISVNLIKQYINSTKLEPSSEANLNKELLRKFDRFIKTGLLYKRYDGAQTVYVRTELMKEVHKTYGTDKLVSAYSFHPSFRKN